VITYVRFYRLLLFLWSVDESRMQPDAVFSVFLDNSLATWTRSRASVLETLLTAQTRLVLETATCRWCGEVF